MDIAQIDDVGAVGLDKVALLQQRLHERRKGQQCFGGGAVGMVEPGHFVVIVADGRQPGYSVGFTLMELADLTEAENIQ